MSNLGMGVMIGMLAGNKETVEAVQSALGKKIDRVEQVGEVLNIHMKDGFTLELFDDGQSCCESRYMRTDDDLSEFTNTTLKEIELKEAPQITDEYGDHEVQFLEVKTGKGSFVMSSHNEHNGYYGGFMIVARIRKP